MKWGTMLVRLVCGSCLAWTLSVPAVAQIDECATTGAEGTDDEPCTEYCPTKGECDCPAKRDLWDVGESFPGAVDITIPVRIHVFGGSPNNPSNDAMDDQVLAIIDHFDDWNIVLDATWHRVTDDPDYETITSGEIGDMKSDYAEDPDSQLNVYVSTYSAFDWSGLSTFPWRSKATGTQGGIMIDRVAVGQHKTLLTHEIGHALGLWHTFHGTAEARAATPPGAMLLAQRKHADD